MEISYHSCEYIIHLTVFWNYLLFFLMGFMNICFLQEPVLCEWESHNSHDFGIGKTFLTWKSGSPKLPNAITQALKHFWY